MQNRIIFALTASSLVPVCLASLACERKDDTPPPQYAQQQPYPPQPYPNQPPPYPNAPPTYAPTATAPPPTYPPPAPQPTYAPPQPQPQPAPQPTNTSPFPLPFPQPAPQPSAGGANATPIDPNLAGVATVPLMAFAVTEAPGMQREGAILAGQFQQGQTLEQPVNLTPGKCYTVLAVGIGMQEVDIALMLSTPVPGMNPVLQRDTGAGHQASLGGKGNCYKWPAPLAAQGKYVVTATKGAGMAAAQLYVK